MSESNTWITLLNERIGTSVARGARPDTLPGGPLPPPASTSPLLTSTLPVAVPWPGFPE